jgi:hypothetical protein
MIYIYIIATVHGVETWWEKSETFVTIVGRVRGGTWWESNTDVHNVVEPTEQGTMPGHEQLHLGAWSTNKRVWSLGSSVSSPILGEKPPFVWTLEVYPLQNYHWLYVTDIWVIYVFKRTYQWPKIKGHYCRWSCLGMSILMNKFRFLNCF